MVSRLEKKWVAAALVALVLPLVAFAQMKPEEAIRARQSIMRVIALNFGPIGKMSAGEAPFDKKKFQENAERIKSVWEMNVGQYFVPGTDKPVPGSKIAEFTAAKPELFSQPDKLKSIAGEATQRVNELAEAAKSGDEAKMKAAAGALGKSCKACHDEFRQQK
jgi:cytochrome c556